MAFNMVHNDTNIEEGNGTVTDWLHLDRNYTSKSTSNSTFDEEWELPKPFSYTIFSINCVLFIIGIFGNVSIISVVMRSHNRSSSYNVLVLILAISDMLSLTTNSVNQQTLLKVVDIDFRALTDIGCKTIVSLQRTTSIMSISIIVLIAIERFIVVVFPLKAKVILSRKVTIRSLCICGVLVLLFGIGPSFLISPVNEGRCSLNSNFMQNRSGTIFAYSISIVVPFLVVLALTSIIIYKLYKQNAKRANLTSNKTLRSGQVRKTIMLTSVIVVYVILVGIPTTLFLVFQLNSSQNDITTRDLIERACSLTCMQVNYSINFLVYGLSNVDFRQRLLSMLGCPCKRNHSAPAAMHSKPAGKVNSIQSEQIWACA